jgi:hypothetical protein
VSGARAGAEPEPPECVLVLERPAEEELEPECNPAELMADPEWDEEDTDDEPEEGAEACEATLPPAELELELELVEPPRCATE